MRSISQDRRLPGRVLLSIHDVGPRFESEVDALHDRLSDHAGANRMAMLVVPNHWNQAPIQPSSPFAGRMRRWAELGIEIFVHGWFHRDQAEHHDRLSRFKARHMTAGEGEFLGLSTQEAVRRMRDGRALIESITGQPVAGFVAPAWLYGAGALEALIRTDFAIAEDHMRVWHPPSGKTLCRGPVVTWASRSRPRIASSLMVAYMARAVLTRAAIVRIAVHPGDIHVPSLVRSIDRTVSTFCRSHVPARYADLLSE